MTEKHVPYTAQMYLFDDGQPPAGLNRDEKVAYILEHWPECRNDDRLLMLRFWEVFDGMAEVLGEQGARRFRAWFCKATHPETIRRGRASVQKLRRGGGALLPSDREAERRRALAGAGPPRGRW